MEELFDSINDRPSTEENSFPRKYQSSAETIVENPEEIIEELCQLSGDLPSFKSASRNDFNPNVECQGEVSSNLKLQDPPVLEELLEKDESLIPATSHNVGIINAACQQVLREMEQQLLALLKQNRKEQEMVQNFLTSKGKINYVTKKANLKCAGIPYFKDLDGFPPPLNEDVLKKKRQNQLVPADILENAPVWSNNDAKVLVKAVNSSGGDQSINSDAIDWMKISATDMEGKYSPLECKSKWLMNLSPSINRSRWTAKEIKSLELLADKYHHQDWDRIALELGTNRSCLQCCVQYQAHRPPNEGKWSKEEDELLKNLIEKYRVRDYIPWIKVTWHFERRSLRQCQERYAYHLVNIKKGNFTMEEDFVLTYLATKLKNFGEVAKFLPKRVSTQIRARYEYLVQASMPEFSKEEDELLGQLMVKYPRNWSKISESFKDRSKVQCRKRWAELQKNIKLRNDTLSESESDEVEMQAGASCRDTNKEKKDAKNVVKNLEFVSKPNKPRSRRYPEQYTKLINYHKHCHKFLFGPKPRIISSEEDCKQLCKQMRVMMNYLSVSQGAPSTSFKTETLSRNCEFSNEDVTVLNEMKKSVSKEVEVELSSKIIPPNYTTLVGLKTLLLSWDKIRSLCNHHKPTEPSRKIDSDSRILGTDAKKLFKTRMKSLFAFPLILSNISQEGIETKWVQKPKTSKKSKAWSKRRRKEHSKLMTHAYREKLHRKLTEQNLEEVMEDGDMLNYLSLSRSGLRGVDERENPEESSRRRHPPKSEPPAKKARTG